MGDCCHNKDDLAKQQSQVLWIVLAINFLFFFIEMYYGLVANSLALVGDSLDMLGDALAYGSTLYVVTKSQEDKIKSARFKAYLMLGTGIFTFIKAMGNLYFQTLPEHGLMFKVGIVVLLANLFCLFLLTRHKNDDINFQSVWICSRNDIISNSSVLVASYLVMITQTLWPDLIVGLFITALFTRSALKLFRETA